MRSKQKTRDTVIRKEERVEGGNRYCYELLMSESDRVVSWRIPLYSIRISMTDADGKDTSSDIKDTFVDAGKAILFFEKLVRNLATPIDLAYILEDEMA